MKHLTEIIYMDIDGTLRDEQTGVPASAAEAIRECRRQGIRIILCTGRNAGSIQDDVSAIETDGVISGGGCYIRCLGKTLRKQFFPEALLEQLLKTAQAEGLFLSMESEYKVYMDRRAAEFYRADFEHKINGADHGEVESANKICYQDNLEEFYRESRQIHKLCLFGSREAIDKAQALAAESAEVIQKRRWNGLWYLELLPPGCHKGNAVKALNRWLGIPKCSSMGFGDGENDIPMLQATGISVAMGQGSPRLAALADSVCEPPAEDGLYKELVRRDVISPQTFGQST